MRERWQPIPGYEGAYEASDLGRIRSVERKIWCPRGVGFWRGVPARILAPSWSRGYQRVTLYREGEGRTILVHRLVLMAFVGPCPEGMEGCHADDDARNNTLANLRWDTSSANHRERTRNGGNPNALKTHCPHGHPYSPANTYWHSGGRKCRTCVIRRNVAYKQRKRAARKEAA